MRISPKLLFGEGFYQDGEVFVIDKTSLPRLTLSVDNSAQSLLAGLIAKAASAYVGFLQNESGEVLATEDNKPLEFDNRKLYELMTVSFWRVYPQKRFGVPVITHTYLFEIYASPEIPYEQPITPSDL